MSDQTHHTHAAPVVLVTRPADRSGDFIQHLERAGFCCVHLPMLEISSLPPAEQQVAVKSLLHHLPGLDLAIFISTNAVHFTRQCLAQHSIDFPAGLPCLPIGRATASAIEQAGWTLSPAPASENSEGLLELAELQPGRVCGKKVGIFRGVGGREHLAQQLAERGAEVDYIECYRRIRPRYSRSNLADLFAAKHPAAIVFSSGETMDNFLYYARADNMTGKVQAIPLVVPSRRLQRYADELGFSRVVVSEGAGASATCEALVALLGQVCPGDN